MWPIDATFFERVFGAREFFENLVRIRTAIDQDDIEHGEVCKRYCDLRNLARDYLARYALVI